MMRLDKMLCELQVGSRSQVKEYIKKGMVTVDGAVAKKPEQKVDEQADITFQGKQLSYAAYEYYLLHKPAGCVSATTDRHCKTVLDYITDRRRNDLFPVGRLDKDTEGLLLITNDGALAHDLLSPKKHVAKTYYARVRGPVTEEHRKQFAAGVDIGDEKPTLPAELVILKTGEESEIELTISEGRFHQVKRMFEAVGCTVTYLKRLSMGGLTLDETLAPGAYRPLTEEELRLLKG